MSCKFSMVLSIVAKVNKVDFVSRLETQKKKSCLFEFQNRFRILKDIIHANVIKKLEFYFEIETTKIYFTYRPEIEVYKYGRAPNKTGKHLLEHRLSILQQHHLLGH